MIALERARELANLWRSRFTDIEAFEESWRKFFALTGDPTETKLENWLTKDLAKDQILNAGIVREPTVPQVQRFDVVTDPELQCSGCKGKRYVYFESEMHPSHPRFGTVHPCPACSATGRTDAVVAPPPNANVPERNDCWKCGRFEDEPAGPQCSNPRWHVSFPPDAPLVPGNLGAHLDRARRPQ